jgi:segregation and condensation protein B
MTLTNDTPITPEQLAVIIESLLFVADHPVAVSDLVKTLDASKQQVEQALTILDDLYQTRGLRLQRNGSSVQLVTASDITGYVEKFLGLSISSKLSTAAMEVLGIVAYRQPMTRPEIEAIRGVNCDGVLRTLLSKGLIEEVGRLNTVGHPIQYGTTFEFLQYFGLSSLDELPALAMEQDEEADLFTFEQPAGTPPI